MKGFPDHRDVLARQAKPHPGQADLFASTGRQKRSTEERYRAWRLTPTGQAFWTDLLARALRQASAGDERIGSKQLVEATRKALRASCDNRFTACIARDLTVYQALAPLIELRPRKVTEIVTQ